MKAYSKTPGGKAAMKRVYQKIRREKPERQLLWYARSSAKKRGSECTITMDDISVPDRCPVLGIPLVYADGPRNDATPSIDRIDPAKGYIPGNVHVVSWRANKIKQDATLTELRSWVRVLEGLCGIS